MPTFDLVVYGGNPWCVCTAVAAKKVAPAMSVALVADYPDLTESDASKGGFSRTRLLGGIYSVGAEATWDDYGVAGGTYRDEIYSRTGRHYRPQELADALESLAGSYEIDVHYGYHLSDFFVSRGENGRPILTEIGLRPTKYGLDHTVEWDPYRPTLTLKADIFVDGSVDARIIRMTSPDSVTIGRYDWPAELLTATERNAGTVQSTSLDIRLDNFSTADKWGGEWMKEVLKPGSAFYYYNVELYGRTGGRLFCGPADWTAEDESKIWTTGSHVFNMDPRAFQKDRGTGFFPTDMPSDAVTYDDGYARLRSEIEHGEYIEALREGLGMPDLDLLTVASLMYVRECAHCVIDPSLKNHETENTNYSVTTVDALLAGSAGERGADGRHFWQRVGVAHYGVDLHAFDFEDLYDPDSGTFFWDPDVQERIRPDITRAKRTNWTHEHGFWIPWEASVSREMANVLLCGYNVSVSSVAWGELREAPNMCTVGDACGATAGVLYSHGGYSIDLPSLIGDRSFIKLVQNALVQTVGANLDKKSRKYAVAA